MNKLLTLVLAASAFALASCANCCKTGGDCCDSNAKKKENCESCCSSEKKK